MTNQSQFYMRIDDTILFQFLPEAVDNSDDAYAMFKGVIQVPQSDPVYPVNLSYSLSQYADVNVTQTSFVLTLLTVYNNYRTNIMTFYPTNITVKPSSWTLKEL